MPEFSELSKFFHPQAVNRVIGTYLYPYRLFGNPDYYDPYSATEIISQVNAEGTEVLITRNGGLFVHIPSDILDMKDTLVFQEIAADILNCIICEFAFKGIVSEPATPSHMSTGSLIDNHALIIAASGGRESYLERSLAPTIRLVQGNWGMCQPCSLDIVHSIEKLECTSKLRQISKNIPTLVAGAYSFLSQRQIAEALNDGWVVIEQIINLLWDKHIASIIETPRKNRLSDSRTYTTAVRIEVLYISGVLSKHLYEALNIARQHRNDLAHRAKITLEMAEQCLIAMKNIIEFVCEVSVEPPIAHRSVNW